MPAISILDEFTLDASKILMKSFEDADQPDSALKYVKLMLTAKDSIFSQARTQQALLLDFDEKQRRQEIESAKEKYQTQLRLYGLIRSHRNIYHHRDVALPE